jgi:NAD(P)-dependent dehydrogenase (short-subunit alcohol dehydrogenase family)
MPAKSFSSSGKPAGPLCYPRRFTPRSFLPKVVERSRKGLGGLDIVVCNAGRQQSKPSILDITTEDFDAAMKTNIYAVLEH